MATFLRAHGATVKSAKAAKLLCTAAAAGNIDRLVRLLAEGSDINVSDYDGRTALHLAASEGHAPAVRWLLLHGANAKALDRFGGSPLDDSYREDRQPRGAPNPPTKLGAHRWPRFHRQCCTTAAG